MALSNRESLNQGLSAVRFRTLAGLLVGQDSLVGNITADINPSVVPTMGAASTYASYYRTGASEGSGTISLNDRPKFIDGDISGGTITETAASATPTVGTLSATNGTTLTSGNSALTFTTPGTVSNNFDFLVEATGAAQLAITYVSDRGEQNIVNVAIDDSATPIGNTGVSVASAASSPSFTTGDRAEISIHAPHGGSSRIAVPQFRTGNYYELVVWSAEGGADDTSEKLTFPRVFIVGASISKTAKEMPTTEIQFNVCAPLDGSDAFIRELWTPPTS